MDGLIWAQGPCCVCHTWTIFHPDHVPSYQGLPICLDCITRINTEKTRRGLPAVRIVPGAYPEFAGDDGSVDIE